MLRTISGRLVLLGAALLCSTSFASADLAPLPCSSVVAPYRGPVGSPPAAPLGAAHLTLAPPAAGVPSVCGPRPTNSSAPAAGDSCAFVASSCPHKRPLASTRWWTSDAYLDLPTRARSGPAPACARQGTRGPSTPLSGTR